MNKVTTAALAGLLVVAAGAQASASRWAGFGAASAYIADVQDIFSLPGVVASHADTTYLEMGVSKGTIGGPSALTLPAMTSNDVSLPNNAWGGVHGKLAGGVLGVWFNRTDGSLGNINQGLLTIPNASSTVFPSTYASLTNQVAVGLHNQFEVIYGYPLSDSTTLGLGISRATNSSKVETAPPSPGVNTTNGSGLSDFGISLGVEQKEVGPIALLEVGLQYNSVGANATDSGSTTSKITGAGTGINLRVGGDLAGENGMFGRLELGFSSQSLNYKDEPATALATTIFQESKNSATSWNLGYAMGGTNEKGMGLMGFMLSGLNQTCDQGTSAAVSTTALSNMHLLATTAGEAKVNNWLSFRAGLESDLFYSASKVTDSGLTGSTTKQTTSNDAHAGTLADPNAKISMGTTLTLGNVIIDGVLNQGLMYSGTFLVSGIPQALSTQVSLTWPWGGSKQ